MINIIKRLKPNPQPIIMTRLWAVSCAKWPSLKSGMLRAWWRMTGIEGRRDLVSVHVRLNR